MSKYLAKDLERFRRRQGTGTLQHVEGGALQQSMAGAACDLRLPHLAFTIDGNEKPYDAFLAARPGAPRIPLVRFQPREQDSRVVGLDTRDSAGARIVLARTSVQARRCAGPPFRAGNQWHGRRQRPNGNRSLRRQLCDRFRKGLRPLLPSLPRTDLR